MIYGRLLLLYITLSISPLRLLPTILPFCLLPVLYLPLLSYYFSPWESSTIDPLPCTTTGTFPLLVLLVIFLDDGPL